MKRLAVILLVAFSCSDGSEPSSRRITNSEDLAPYFNTWAPETYSVGTSIESDAGYYIDYCDVADVDVAEEFKFLVKNSVAIEEANSLTWNELCGFDVAVGSYSSGNGVMEFTRADDTFDVELLPLSDRKIRILYKLPTQSLVITYKIP